MRRDGRFQGSLPPAFILLPAIIAAVVATGGCDYDTNGDPVETFSADQAQYAEICTDLHDVNNPDDDTRVDDDQCGDDDEDGNASNGGFSFIWIDLGHNQSFPRYGQPVYRGMGTNTHPRGAVVMKKMPSGTFTTSSVKSGAIKPASPVQRGGFGLSSQGSSGG